MNIELTLENLKIIAADLLDAAQGQNEVALLTEMSQHPSIAHREGLIKIRDQALEQCAFDWAILLSHFVYAMTEEKFWQGQVVQPSTH